MKIPAIAKSVFTLIGIFTSVAALVGCVAGRDSYESAAYTVHQQEKNVEIRNYPELKVVTAASKKTEKGDGDGQFMQLFRYISGDNASKEKIAMTTPVFMDKTSDQSKMSFVLPAEVAKKSIPQPSNKKVTLESIPARQMAVLRFTGTQNRENEQKNETALREWLSAKSITPKGDAVFAYYDPPFTPPGFRRNEVMLAVP